MDQNMELSAEEIATLKDFLNLGRALVSSLTSSQLSHFASNLGEIIQTLSDPGLLKLTKAVADCSDTLADLVKLTDVYYRSGTIKNAFELVTLLGVVKDAVSTQSVTRFAEDANAVIVAGDQLASALGGVSGLEKLANFTLEASKEAAQDNRTVGVMGLIRSLKEPQVQKGIKFFLHLAERLNEGANQSVKPPGRQGQAG